MSQPVILVLAGGASNRFWPLRDKLLLEFGAATLLERHLRMLRELGCERFVVVSGPDGAERIRALIGSLALPDARVAVQSEPKGMADAVLCARNEIASFGEGPLYITQAHDVVGPELHRDVLESPQDGSPSASSGGAFGLIAAARVKSYFPGGYLELAGGRIRAVVEKPGAGKEPSDLVNLVAHRFASWRPLVDRLEAEALRQAQDGPQRTSAGGLKPLPYTPQDDALRQAQGGPQDDAYERALSSLMRERDFRPVVYEGRWQGLKYPWHVLDVMDLMLERWTTGKESPGEGYRLSEDGVFMGRDVRVFPGSHVVGPALIGHGCVIGHNALVRGSIVGARSVVGFGCEVARSFLGEGVELHHNYVGDSVLGARSSMGYGATTANFRLDGRTVPSVVAGERLDTGREKLGLVLGEGTKIGVNTSTMPGVKIGAGALIGPNLRIARDVPDGARVLNDGEYGRL